MLAAQSAASAFLILATPGPSSRGYAYPWLISEIVLSGFRAAAGIEAYRYLAARFRAPSPMLPVAAAILAAAGVWASWGQSALQPAHALFFGFGRASWAILALGFASSWRFLTLPGAALHAVTVHASLYLAYATSQALPFAGAHLSGRVGPMSAAALVGAAVVQLAWCALLQNPEPGEIVRDEGRAAWLRMQAERLLRAVERRG